MSEDRESYSESDDHRLLEDEDTRFYWTLNALAMACHSVAVDHGFWDDIDNHAILAEYAVPLKVALIHSEVSECLEADRVGNETGMGEELADVIIRVLDLCAWLGVDVDTEVARKMAKNKARTMMHGGKRY